MEISHQIETLKNMGLKENEAKAYLTLLTIQEATASKLAKEMKTLFYPKIFHHKNYISRSFSVYPIAGICFLIKAANRTVH